MNHLFDDSWVTLHFPLLYNPSFSTPYVSFLHFSFREQEEGLRVRVCLSFLRVERILFEFSIFFISSKFVKCENFSKYENLKFSHNFKNTKHSFIKLQTFSFIEPHETHFSITDYKNLFSPESNEIYLGIEWDLFLHDPKWKSYHMKSSSFFQFLVEFSSPVHEFGCSTHFDKFVSLRTSSMQNHMSIGNQVQDWSKCTIKLMESFHHL